MAEQKDIRFGAIGCGGAGTDRIKQLAKHELGLRVVAAVDIAPERLDNLAQVIGYDDFKRYTGPEDYKRLIEENDLDAVGIFTPHVPHYDHVKYAIEHDMNVLIEKPMVCGAARALEITRMMEARKKKVGIIHYQRHFELKYMKARELIQQGVIGDLTNFYIYMAQDWSGRGWRGEPEFSGGGQINDSGSHYQDIMLWMTGLMPISAQGNIDSFYRGQEQKVEFNGSFNVQFSNGVSGRIIILSDIPGGFVDDVRICGTKGRLMFQGERLIHFDQETNKYNDVPLARPENYPVSPCDNFMKLLRRKVRTNQVPFIFGCRVALLTEALLRSGHAKGKKIMCEDIMRESGHSLKDLEV